VQFKILDQTAHVLGLAEGATLVTRLWSVVDQTRIGSEILPVLEAGLTRRRECLGEAETSLLYRFRTPWLGLNQENHFLYEAQSDPAGRLAVLERAIVGNCLSLAKGFRHWVEGRIAADCRGLKPVPAGLKGVAMVGFVGTFRVNFHIPDHAGIGKSVSRGFGTVERIAETAGSRERSSVC
jgi:Cas6b C-terminal domain